MGHGGKINYAQKRDDFSERRFCCMSFILSCESTVDLPYSYVESRKIPVLFYSYLMNGQTYVDDMLRDSEALPAFYRRLKEGQMASTSQINETDYLNFFDEQLQKGDLLHLAFGSGMTNSVANAQMAAEKMREKYPNRRLIVLDSLASSSGYGLLVDTAADMRDAGAEMEEIEAWILANRNRVHHQFFSTDLKYFRRGGRVSGPAAMIGTILNICPLMHLNADGRIIAYGKVRGKKNAIAATVDWMKEHAQGGEKYDGKCFISHSHCWGDAEETRREIEAAFPKLRGKVRIFDIGTIIACHTGPGTVAVFFMGDEREAGEK